VPAIALRPVTPRDVFDQHQQSSLQSFILDRPEEGGRRHLEQPGDASHERGSRQLVLGRADPFRVRAVIGHGSSSRQARDMIASLRNRRNVCERKAVLETMIFHPMPRSGRPPFGERPSARVQNKTPYRFGKR
jgi:hypothetical protein